MAREWGGVRRLGEERKWLVGHKESLLIPSLGRGRLVSESPPPDHQGCVAAARAAAQWPCPPWSQCGSGESGVVAPRRDRCFSGHGPARRLTPRSMHMRPVARALARRGEGGDPAA